MRRALYQGAQVEAVALLARAPYLHLAGTDEQNQPILKTLHGVVVGGDLCFHGAPAGEKQALLGRPVVACAEEVLAEIPSYFIDPQRACPATTWYLSVQVHGVLEEVADPARKAQVLQALMARFQPEGGHVPITADHSLYARAVQGIQILRLPLDGAVCKAKLGQNRPVEQRVQVLERLWQRGLPGDPLAIERVRELCPELPDPPFLQGLPGLRLRGQGLERDVAGAVDLLRGQYWTRDESDAQLAEVHRRSTAWVVALDGERVVGTARAVTDGGRHGWVYDVAVAKALQRRGIATALMRLLLDHPALRSVRKVHLNTKDAEPLYAPLGFERHVDPPWRLHLTRERA